MTLSGSEKQPCKHGSAGAKDGLEPRDSTAPYNAPPAARTKCRSTIVAFLLGVLLTAGVAQIGIQGVNHRWEWDAYNHGYGYFTFRIVQRDHWTFHWFERPQPKKAERIRI